MLGEVVAEESSRVGGLEQAQAPLLKQVEPLVAAFDMIENAKSYLCHNRVPGATGPNPHAPGAG